MGAQAVPVGGGDADDVLVIDVVAGDEAVVKFGGERHLAEQAGAGERLAVKARAFPPGGGPRVEVGQFDRQDRSLERVEAEITADKIVVILFFHAVHAHRTQLWAVAGVPRDRHAAVAETAEEATLQVGNLVNTQSILTSVSQLNPIKAYFSISDSEYLALVQRTHAAGGDLLKKASSVPLTLTLANGEVFPQRGRIAFVDRQINAQTGAIRIAASFPNPGNILRPGQFGRVKAETQLRHNALLIPQVAIQELQGLQQAFVVGPDNKAHLVTLKLGPQIGTNWLVEGGVAPGDKVITDNLLKLGEGAPVSPHAGPPAAPTAQTTTSAGR